jgi:hypothetical protein
MLPLSHRCARARKAAKEGQRLGLEYNWIWNLTSRALPSLPVIVVSLQEDLAEEMAG